MTNVPRPVAAFDFDGTLTTRDTLRQSCFNVGPGKFIGAVVKSLPVLGLATIVGGARAIERRALCVNGF